MLYAACAEAQLRACSPFPTEKTLVSFFLVLGSFFPAELSDRWARRHRINVLSHRERRIAAWRGQTFPPLTIAFMILQSRWPVASILRPCV
jgi:hypothetical protein